MASPSSSPSSTTIPSFGERQYWQDRYTTNPKPYDWLNEADILNEHLDKVLSSTSDPSPRILHVGCGNSELSFNLRLKVRDPAQIHNIDYSSVVIAWGRAREQAMFDSRWDDGTGESSAMAAAQPVMPMMRWDEVDLLSLQSMIAKCSPLAGYAVMLDKSTCDSLACTSTAEVSIPYFLYAEKEGGEGEEFLDISESYLGTANAVQLLAVHLALLTKTGGSWIAYSYSSTRFWFLDEEYQENGTLPMSLHPDLPNPKDLWRLVVKRTVVKPYGKPGETTPGEAGDTHFLYVMERTSTALKVRSMEREAKTDDV